MGLGSSGEGTEHLVEGQRGQDQHSQDSPTDTPVGNRIATDPQSGDDGQTGCQDLSGRAEPASPGCLALCRSQPGVDLQYIGQDRVLGSVSHQIRGAMGQLASAVGQLTTQRHQGGVGSPGQALGDRRHDDGRQ